jgi:mannosyltransferase OCH1-like enzyme
VKYKEETYDELIKQSYGYHDQYDSDSHCVLLKSLYENNYIKGNGESKIPKKIHQIWIGGPLPEEYKAFTQSWMIKNPEWEYKLWTDKDVKDLNIKKRRQYEYATNFGMRADILRYEILAKQGGLYADVDFECLKSFNDLLYLDFFTSIGYERKVELYIGLIACVPNHPIITECINGIKMIPKKKGFEHIFNSTGSYHFTRSFFTEVEKDGNGVVAFPMGFFYPFPNNMRKLHGARRYIKPY